ncbi:PD-(D/E)XK nuclease family protein [Siccirubricoccus deserti]
MKRRRKAWRCRPARRMAGRRGWTGRRASPCDRPAPRPPRAARPRSIAVTEVETLLADPYAFYARRVLGLRALDPLDADVGAADYGNLVHAAMARFIQGLGVWPGEAAAAALFRDAATAALEAAGARPGLAAFWRPRLARIGSFAVAAEAELRQVTTKSQVELKGELKLLGGQVRLTARADRIDVLPNGKLAILDYKTGSVPSAKQVREGHKPQLVLEAAMVARGGFPTVTGDAGRLDYWRLTGGPTPGEVTTVCDNAQEIADLAEAALEEVQALAQRFLLGEAPFLAWPHPGREPAGDDYDHLSRRAEWAGAEDAAEG